MKIDPAPGMLLVAACMIFAAGISISSRAGESGASVEQPVLDTPQAVYSTACASCHGADGTGMPQATVGFDTPLPDFTDCSFATREPDGDWYAVAHQGGPVRGFDHRMPSFGMAAEAEQLEMAVKHIRTFCVEDGWPSGDLNQPRPMFTEKAFVEDEAVLTIGSAVQEPYEVLAELVYEKRFGKRSQLEIAIPFGAAEMEAASEDESDEWVGGLGDVAFGLKHVLVAALSTGSILSGIAEVVLPTGVEDDGLGGGVFVFEPGLTFSQSLGPAGFMHLQAGAEVPVEENPTPEAFWRAVYGYTFTEGAFGRAWSPMIEVLGSMDLESGASAHWDIVPQVQFSLNTRQHVMLGLATRIPLEPDNGRPIGVWLYLLWEWFDGGFGEGW